MSVRSSIRSPSPGRNITDGAGTPGLPRRLASLAYEAVLLFGVAFFAGWLFFLASGGRDATSGAPRHALQALLLASFAAYFLWCWLRGGQTLAMKTWRIKLVDASSKKISAGKALLRIAYAAVLVPTGISILWAFLDRDRQFLHDRLAGTRLVSV